MQQRWHRLWESIASSDPESEYSSLVKAYGETHRAYHNLDHISDCLDQLDSTTQLPEHRVEVELALWFHDVVYSTRSDRNEQASAEWAAHSLGAGGVSERSTERVCELIMATRHAAVPEDLDSQLIVDIDLSILGRPRDEFDVYEQKIRREYRWVPGPLFRRKRAEVLETFLARPSIFSTEEFRDRYETQARSNLDASIRSLRGRTG